MKLVHPTSLLSDRRLVRFARFVPVFEVFEVFLHRMTMMSDGLKDTLKDTVEDTRDCRFAQAACVVDRSCLPWDRSCPGTRFIGVCT